MLDYRRVAAGDDLRITKPCDCLAHILDILASVGDDQVAGIDLGERYGSFRRNEGNGFGRPDAVVGVNLAVVDAANAGFREVRLGHPVTANQFGNVSQRLELDAVRAKLGDQAVNAAHARSPSRSATMASICVRSSACRATMWAISALSAEMSTASVVSGCST